MATAKFKKGKDGYYSTNVWDGTYKDNGKKRYKHLRSKKSSKDLERIVKEFEQLRDQRQAMIYYLLIMPDSGKSYIKNLTELTTQIKCTTMCLTSILTALNTLSYKMYSEVTYN